MLQTVGMRTISKESVKESKEYSPSWFEDSMLLALQILRKWSNEQRKGTDFIVERFS